jgi:signal transduction histidine kinase
MAAYRTAVTKAWRGAWRETRQRAALGGATALGSLMAASPCLAASPSALLTSLPALIPIGGAFALAAAVALKARQEIRLSQRRADRAEARMAQIQGKLGQLEAILATEPGAVMLWPVFAAADAEPKLFGRLAGLETAAEDGGYAALLASLTAPDSERLAAAVAGLREDGLAFSMALKARDGRSLEAEGRPTAGIAAVWIRDGSAERQEIDRLVGLLAGSEAERAGETELLDALPLPVWRRNEALELIWVNNRYAEAVERDTPDAVVQEQSELDAMGRQLAQRARRDGTPVSDAHALVIAGERRVVETTEIPALDGSLGFALDITALDEARQELDRLGAANRDVLDHIRTAVAIFGPDRALRFFNKAYTDLWRIDPDWLATHPKDGEILEALREARRLPEQANFPQWKRKRMALYTKVVAEPEEIWHLPDGRTLRVVIRPHPHGGLVYLYHDVSDQLALETSHRLLIGVQRATLDKLYEGVALFGSDGLLKLHNPAFARIWSIDPERLQNSPHFAEVAEWCRGQLDDARAWEQLAAHVTSLDAERRADKGRFERRDGTIIDYMVIPLPDGASLLTMLDVTASEQLARSLAERNDALEAADRMKSDFVSHVSYQLRTPLNTIIGFSTMLDQAMLAEPLAPKQKEYVGNVLSASNQLLRLIDDILDLATIEAGRMTLDLSEMDVARALEWAIGVATKRAQEGKLSLELKLEEGLGRIEADERRIKQVVFNLLQNAIAFTPPGGRIAVQASRSGGELRLTVTDTGQGIAPRAQATVFDRFEAKGSDGRRGAGLGLSLVKSFVQLHGGWVELESEPGKGTRVTCHLPERARIPVPAPDRDAAE